MYVYYVSVSSTTVQQCWLWFNSVQRLLLKQTPIMISTRRIMYYHLYVARSCNHCVTVCVWVYHVSSYIPSTSISISIILPWCHVWIPYSLLYEVYDSMIICIYLYLNVSLWFYVHTLCISFNLIYQYTVDDTMWWCTVRY